MQIEKDAKEWIKKKEGISPLKKFSRYKTLLCHFYVVYFLLLLLTFSLFF